MNHVNIVPLTETDYTTLPHCPVCLDLIRGHDLIDLPGCGHKLHSACFVQMLEYQIRNSGVSGRISLTCPICRGSVVCMPRALCSHSNATHSTASNSNATHSNVISPQSAPTAVMVQINGHIDDAMMMGYSSVSNTHCEACSLLTMLTAMMTLLYFVFQCVVLSANPTVIGGNM